MWKHPSHSNGVCNQDEHQMHRRRFLQGMGSGLGASMLSWSGLMTPKVFAEIAKQQQKRCILLWLCGAPSQPGDLGPQTRTDHERAFSKYPDQTARGSFQLN